MTVGYLDLLETSVWTRWTYACGMIDTVDMVDNMDIVDNTNMVDRRDMVISKYAEDFWLLSSRHFRMDKVDLEGMVDNVDMVDIMEMVDIIDMMDNIKMVVRCIPYSFFICFLLYVVAACFSLSLPSNNFG